jgi:hypothetical protein
MRETDVNGMRLFVALKIRTHNGCYSSVAETRRICGVGLDIPSNF